MFRKTSTTAQTEATLQRISAEYGFSPKVLCVEDDVIMMEDLEADTLYDIYGDEPSDVPDWIWDEIRTMVSTLYEEEGIEYVDITPYNFIEKDNRIYMIDFGDAKYTAGEPNWFLGEFLEGSDNWNPDFA